MSVATEPASGRAEAIIDRLHTLHPRLIDLSLERLERLLGELGHPEQRLPPVIHVAGTNGKGSTVAFLRAIAEAAGQRVHVYTSPHLVRFNERIRIGGNCVTDDALADALATLERINNGAPITVFEMVTTVAFFLFAAHPADLCLLEVGLGGRFDATNVIPPPLVSAITSISLDHQEFLGDTLAAIAFEKAGIIRRGVPVVIGAQLPEALAVVRQEAARLDAPLLARGEAWEVAPLEHGFRYGDAKHRRDLPSPALAGPHQHDNAGIALAALDAAGLSIPDSAIAAGLLHAEWPARLQRLTGRLASSLPPGFSLWLDGGHNPGAGRALAAHLAAWRDQPLHLIVGMKSSKDIGGFLEPILPFADSVFAVAEPGQHLAAPIEEIIAASGGRARSGPTVAAALVAIGRAHARTAPARILICGSLYLAGEVLKQDLEQGCMEGMAP
ncbi:MAG TPA: folylpolyglutamate synthase/dihydrofolate synthase family protein [Acetobacteraceae bacterium]|nr:folylpolyglutamate synthase/dihydrofolate synthase family protein [Acetobacteraceae bacterium]